MQTLDRKFKIHRKQDVSGHNACMGKTLSGFGELK